jgi:hypothetical protein
MAFFILAGITKVSSFVLSEVLHVAKASIDRKQSPNKTVRGDASDLCSGSSRFEFWPRHHYSDRVSSVPPGKYWDTNCIRPRPLPSKSLPVCHSLVILPSDAVPS